MPPLTIVRLPVDFTIKFENNLFSGISERSRLCKIHI